VGEIPFSLHRFLTITLLAVLLEAGCSAPAYTGGEIASQPDTSARPDPIQPTARPNPTLTPTARPTQSPTITVPPTSRVSPTTTLTPAALACWQQGGHIENGSLPNKWVSLPLEYSVYLPPCYAEQSERRYPVLYLIHGLGYTNDQWVRLGADGTADRLIASGELSPFIIVMPRDMLGIRPTRDGFGQALIEDLVPYIDQHYRTLPDRAYRAIGGLSRGAAWAIHLGLQHWEIFGAIGAHSLPMFWTDIPHLRAWLDAIPDESMPRIFMDIGDKDYSIQSTLWVESVLAEKNIPHEWHLFPGYHVEDYWQAHVELYLRFYARDW
jgi:enterochelin esterase-like enzyme